MKDGLTNANSLVATTTATSPKSVISSLKIYQSREIRNYKLILEGLINDLGIYFYQAILVWCGITSCDEYYKGYYWEMFLIHKDNKPVGFFSMVCQETGWPKDVWIEWLGIIPEYQSMGIGAEVLRFIESRAKHLGFDKIITYVECKDNPLAFYERHGYKKICTMEEYLSVHQNLSADCFGDGSDLVIYKNL